MPGEPRTEAGRRLRDLLLTAERNTQERDEKRLGNPAATPILLGAYDEALTPLILAIEAESAEKWRSIYLAVAEQYAALLEHYGLAEDATAQDIIEAAAPASSAGLDGLRAAATRLVKAWDMTPCQTCGGTGVAWDWPDADDLRAALATSTEEPK